MESSTSKILGVDYGSRRIGMAISDENHTLAFPWRTLEGGDLKHVVSQIQDCLREENIEKIILGLPLTLSGEEGVAAKKVKRFVQALEEVSDIPCELWDERFTTKQASSAMQLMGKTQKQQRATIDQVAATVILQNYLDARTPSEWSETQIEEFPVVPKFPVNANSPRGKKSKPRKHRKKRDA